MARKRKPKFRVGQVVAELNASGLAGFVKVRSVRKRFGGGFDISPRRGEHYHESWFRPLTRKESGR